MDSPLGESTYLPGCGSAVRREALLRESDARSVHIRVARAPGPALWLKSHREQQTLEISFSAHDRWRAASRVISHSRFDVAAGSTPLLSHARPGCYRGFVAFDIVAWRGVSAVPSTAVPSAVPSTYIKEIQQNSKLASTRYKKVGIFWKFRKMSRFFGIYKK